MAAVGQNTIRIFLKSGTIPVLLTQEVGPDPNQPSYGSKEWRYDRGGFDRI